MAFIIWIVLTFGCGYLAYRAIRGGFKRPQSERLNVFGYLALALAVFFGVMLVRSLLG